MVRATVSSYGKSDTKVDFMEVVIHQNGGEIITSKIIKWSGDTNKDGDEIIDFCLKYRVDMACPITEVLQAKQCKCGEWTKRVVTDDDLRRANENNTK